MWLQTVCFSANISWYQLCQSGVWILMLIDVNQPPLSCMVWYTWEAAALETGRGLTTAVVHKLKNLFVAWSVNSWSQISLVYYSFSKQVLMDVQSLSAGLWGLPCVQEESVPMPCGQLELLGLQRSLLLLAVSWSSFCYSSILHRLRNCADLFDYRIVFCVRRKPRTCVCAAGGDGTATDMILLLSMDMRTW